MRAYIGESTPDGVDVWVVELRPGPELEEVAAVLAELRDLNLAREAMTEEERSVVLARKEDLVARITASEGTPRAVALPNPGGDAPFGWGSPDEPAGNLARSILTSEIGGDVPASVYTRFRDDVIAWETDPERFRLSRDDVWSWISANQTLVEREMYERPPQSVVESTRDEVEPTPDQMVPEATASRVLVACEEAWRDIQAHHPDLPNAVMILGSGVERGRLVKLGHWWGARWLADGQVRGEVLLAGEALHLKREEVFEVLLHEAAHGLNAARGIKDTSRGGRYHNQRFREAAQEVLLNVGNLEPYGLARTSLTPEALERYGATIDRLGDAIRIARHLERGAKVGSGGETGRDEQQADTGSTNGRGTPSASCGCGRRLRMAPSVLARGPVVCGLCGEEFSTGADVASNVEVEALGGTLLEAVARKHSQLGALLDAAGPAPQASQVPLRRRHQQMGGLLERLGPGGDLSVGLSAEEERQLAEWYDRRATLHAQPIACESPQQARRLTQLARDLLAADGSITGPSVEVEGRQFRSGDRVIATAGVPGGPEAGVAGTVVTTDPELGSLHLDFPMWARVNASYASALARCLDHDYAVVAATNLASLPSPELTQVPQVSEVDVEAAL